MNTFFATDKQQKILDFIENSIETRGCPPSFREIGEHMGGLSPNAITGHIRLLENKGLIARSVGKNSNRNLLPTWVVEKRKLESAIVKAAQAWAKCIDDEKIDERCEALHQAVNAYKRAKSAK